MIKILSLLFLVSVTLVFAKPSVKQEESIEVVPLTFVHERQDRRSKSSCDGASLILATGNECNGAKRTFACDGSCFDIDKNYYRTLEATGFDATHRASIDFFDAKACVGTYVGAGNLAANICYKANGTVNALSFSCYIGDITPVFTIKPN